MKLTMKTAGMLASIQDFGRFGYMDQGFGPAGAMDVWSMRAANVLVGNDEHAPVLEFCLVGPSFHVEQTTADEPLVIAFTGADFQPTINGEPAPLGVALALRDGDFVASGNACDGMFGYVAVRGGFDVPLAFGSAATSLKYQVGGYFGRALVKGDVLNRGNSSKQEVRELVLPTWLRMENRFDEMNRAIKPDDANLDDAVIIRAVPVAQEHLFTEKGIQTFYTDPYTVTPESDRMGMRLDGPAIESKAGSDIISDGIPLGAVQIPSSGMPIVMMADRQTKGGYAKIATIASVDIATLAQCRAGQKIRFARIGVEEAQQLLHAKEQVFSEWSRSAATVKEQFDYLQRQCSARGLSHLAWHGPAHTVSVEPYAMLQPETC